MDPILSGASDSAVAHILSAAKDPPCVYREYVMT
jgi:hypothetical protein